MVEGNICGRNIYTLLLDCSIYTTRCTVATNSTIANDEDKLGLEGTKASSDKEIVATAKINSGNIDITSKGAGTATITVSDGTNSATIAVTVAANGINHHWNNHKICSTESIE